MASFFRRLFGLSEPAPVTPALPQRRAAFSTHAGLIDGQDPLTLADLSGAVFRVRPGHGMTDLRAAQDSADCGSCGEELGSAFGLGDATGVSEGQLGWYASQTFPGFQILATMAQQWLVAKACALPPEDAMRNGYALKIGDGDDRVDPKISRYFERRAKSMRVAEEAVRASKFNRVFGVRIVLFEVETDDPATYYGNPFNPDAVLPGAYKGITQVDPYWVIPELSQRAAANPAARDFYVPTWWVINGLRIHRSHLVVLSGEEVADVLKPTYQFAGISLVQRIYERVYAAERTANEAPQLAMTKRMRTLKTDLGQATAKQGELETALRQRAQYMSNYGTDVIDKEADDVVMFDTTLADFDNVIMTQYQIVAAIAECPATKLLSTTPKGFNATGEYEESSYHETLRSLQRRDFEPVLDRHHLMLMRSEIAPKFGLDPATPISVDWNPLDTPTAKERAETQEINSRTSKAYFDMGAVDAYEVRDSLIADPHSGYSGLESIERPDEPLDLDTPPDGTPPTA